MIKKLNEFSHENNMNFYSSKIKNILFLVDRSGLIYKRFSKIPYQIVVDIERKEFKVGEKINYETRRKIVELLDGYKEIKENHDFIVEFAMRG